jgi:hypothetical protein
MTSRANANANANASEGTDVSTRQDKRKHWTSGDRKNAPQASSSSCSASASASSSVAIPKEKEVVRMTAEDIATAWKILGYDTNGGSRPIDQSLLFRITWQLERYSGEFELFAKLAFEALMKLCDTPDLSRLEFITRIIVYPHAYPLFMKEAYPQVSPETLKFYNIFAAIRLSPSFAERVMDCCNRDFFYLFFLILCKKCTVFLFGIGMGSTSRQFVSEIRQAGGKVAPPRYCGLVDFVVSCMMLTEI